MKNQILNSLNLRGGGFLVNNNKNSKDYNNNYNSININNTNNNIQNKISKTSAFSLIELSIVLIIIGLLVAGITGGASLIESAKIRAFANELNSYKQAVATFKVAKGRLPGDLNNDGIIGSCGFVVPNCTTETYDVGDFKKPFDEMQINYQQSPFVELYLEKLIDYNENTNNNLKPYSKIFKNEKDHAGYYGFLTYGKYPSNTDDLSNLKESGEVLLEHSEYKLDPEIAKKIDSIIDDASNNSGNVRATCVSEFSAFGGASYDESINDGGYCNYLYYKINL